MKDVLVMYIFLFREVCRNSKRNSAVRKSSSGLVGAVSGVFSRALIYSKFLFCCDVLARIHDSANDK